MAPLESLGSRLTVPLTVHLVIPVHEPEAAVAGVVALLAAVGGVDVGVVVVDAVGVAGVAVAGVAGVVEFERTAFNGLTRDDDPRLLLQFLFQLS